MDKTSPMYLLLPVLVLLLQPHGSTQPGVDGDSTVVIEDFESDGVGALPNRWSYLSARSRKFQPAGPQMAPDEKFYVVSENGNKFLRAYTEAEAQRISLPDSSLDWRLSDFPRLRWRWRARQLPIGAREDRVNDSGGAVYVTFSSTDWLGRPKSIKYVYSSSLSVETAVSTGNVKIIVVSSGRDGIGDWIAVDRNIVEDYRRVFGGRAPDRPFTITLWSDSDNTRSVAEVDFDDIALVR